MTSIAFCGDSFCEITKDEPFRAWTNLLRDHYDARVAVDGLSGRALIHSYEKLLPVIDDVDYIMFCITDPNRLSNRQAQALSINTEIRSTNKLFEAAFHYYTHIFHEEYHSMAQKGILMQIDELMIQKQKKCIWLPCFVNSMQGYMPQSGPISDIILEHISMAEFDITDEDIQATVGDRNITMFTHHWAQKFAGKNPKVEDAKHVMKYVTMCHMNEKNNISLANAIIDIIDSDDFSPRTVEMKGYFNG